MKKKLTSLQSYLQNEYCIIGNPYDGRWDKVTEEILEIKQKLTEKQRELENIEREQLIYTILSDYEKKKYLTITKI